MSVYTVHFKWKDKELSLKARQLDLTHPYFVSIKDLIIGKESRLIIDPSEDEIRRTFGQADHIMIPFQTVTLIEEICESQENRRVMDFKLMDEATVEKDDEI